MVSPTKINGFVEHLAEKVHNLGSDNLVLALSNTDPSGQVQGITSNAVLANVTQVSYTFLSSRSLTITSSSQTSGTYDLVLQDLTVTSSGGTTGPFRYIYVYNDTPSSSPTDPVINVYDNGSSITLQDGETFTTDFTGDYINLS